MYRQRPFEQQKPLWVRLIEAEQARLNESRDSLADIPGVATYGFPTSPGDTGPGSTPGPATGYSADAVGTLTGLGRAGSGLGAAANAALTLAGLTGATVPFGAPFTAIANAVNLGHRLGVVPDLSLNPTFGSQALNLTSLTPSESFAVNASLLGLANTPHNIGPVMTAIQNTMGSRLGPPNPFSVSPALVAAHQPTLPTTPAAFGIADAGPHSIGHNTAPSDVAGLMSALGLAPTVDNTIAVNAVSNSQMGQALSQGKAGQAAALAAIAAKAISPLTFSPRVGQPDPPTDDPNDTTVNEPTISEGKNPDDTGLTGPTGTGVGAGEAPPGDPSGTATAYRHGGIVKNRSKRKGGAEPVTAHEGEFIVNAAATRLHLPKLLAINASAKPGRGSKTPRLLMEA